MSELRRELNFWHALAIVIGTVIGSGVFINLPIVASASGSPILAALSWFLGGLIWIPQIIIISEMATAYPDEGFGYLYLKEAGYPSLAFLYVWTAFLTSDTPSITIIAMSAASSISFFFPVLNETIYARVFAVIIIIILTIPHVRNVKQGGNLQVILTIAKISPLILLIFIGFFYYSSGNLFFVDRNVVDNNNVINLILAGVAATVWSYAGFPNILYMAGEIKNPQKTLPKVLIGSVIGVMLAYVLISLATSAIVPHVDLVKSVGSFANPFLYLPVFSAFAAGFLSITAFISMIGATNACIMVQPRIEYAIAKDGLFFKIFAHVHPKYNTPDYSIMIQSGIAILLTLIGGIESLLGYFTLSYILQNALVFISIFFLRKKENYKPTFIAPFWKMMTILSLLAQAFLIYGTFLAYSIWGVLSALFLIITGLPVYYYFRKK
ncbi:MAG TPA: amino acid permease [Ignavibacteria bacterium]